MKQTMISIKSDTMYLIEEIHKIIKNTNIDTTIYIALHKLLTNLRIANK